MIIIVFEYSFPTIDINLSLLIAIARSQSCGAFSTSIGSVDVCVKYDFNYICMLMPLNNAFSGVFAALLLISASHTPIFKTLFHSRWCFHTFVHVIIIIIIIAGLLSLCSTAQKILPPSVCQTLTLPQLWRVKGIFKQFNCYHTPFATSIEHPAPW